MHEVFEQFHVSSYSTPVWKSPNFYVMPYITLYVAYITLLYIHVRRHLKNREISSQVMKET